MGAAMTRAWRRVPVSIAVSIGMHALVAVGVVGSSLWGAWRTPIDVEITGMSLEDLKDVPLGMPAAGEQRPDAVVAPRAEAPPRRAPRAPDGVDKSAEEKRPPGPRAAEDDPNGGAAPPRPTSVRSYAPRGSRVTALLRVDRLRDTPYATAVDALLAYLPDRRDLFEGTELELLRDFDTVLIATPNPLDATVTFLAARHHLTDARLRAALDRGARATGRKLAWRSERGRPFAERRLASGPAAGGDDIAEKAAGAQPTRDRRLILLAAPSLVVVTPPAYRSLLLQGRGRLPAAGTGAGGSSGAAAGSDGAAAAAPAEDTNAWAALVRRIDAEDGVMPPDAVAMVSASDLFSARSVRSALDVVPGTRGAVDDDAARSPTIMGLPAPRLLTATLGALPAPFANVDAEFTAEADAARWEEEWPRQRHQLLSNPLVVLSGFGALIRRAELTRAGGTVHLHLETTETETKAILALLAAQLTALGR